jgi:predicted  nucleic acid-binding Zn-ribbon protein
MSIFDRVTKAVGDVVDRGKKEVDQFVKIQKINGQIGDFEKSIGDCRGRIQQTKVKIGEMAIEQLRAGTLTSQPMSALLDEITGAEQQIASLENDIAQKRAEIEKLKAEDKEPGVEQPAAAEPPPPPPPPPGAAARLCPQCGAAAGSGAFCPQCGTKLG